MLVTEPAPGDVTGHKVVLPVPQSLLLNAACPAAASYIMAATSRSQRIRAVFNACPLPRLAVTRDEVHFRLPPESFSGVHESGQYSAKFMVQVDDEPWSEFGVDVNVSYRADVATAVKEGISMGRDAFLSECVQKLDLFPFAMEVFLKGFLHQRKMQYVVATSDVERDNLLTQKDPVFNISVLDVLLLRPELAHEYDLPGGAVGSSAAAPAAPVVGAADADVITGSAHDNSGFGAAAGGGGGGGTRVRLHDKKRQLV